MNRNHPVTNRFAMAFEAARHSQQMVGRGRQFWYAASSQLKAAVFQITVAHI